MNIKTQLYKIVIDSDTKYGRRFDIFIQLLIFLSLISFSIETLPDLDEDFVKFLSVFEMISVIIFSIEYILRICEVYLKKILNFFRKIIYFEISS